MAHLSRLLVMLSLAIWLAACSTVAPLANSPAVTDALVTQPPAATKPSAVAPQVAHADAATATDVLPAAAPAETAAGALDDGTPAVDLLAVETPREFERGGASWYGPGFHGRRTANGERYDMNGLTAAHRTLPFGTMVRVRSMVNGREVDVRITDRGPFSRQRVIDVSRAAAEALGMLGLGIKYVLLLVPDSTSAVAEQPQAAAKARRPLRRPGPRAD